MPGTQRGTLHASALFGLAVWLAVLVMRRPEWVETLFLFAPLVLVPLGMALIGASGWVPICCQLPAALLLVVAFGLEPGWSAAALATPWLAFAGLLACTGLANIHQRGWRPLSETVVDTGLVYLPIGAGWAVTARLGARPLDFAEVIVLLTAVHFHYAGFVLPLLTGLAGRQRPGKLANGAALGVIVGVPLVAVGITARQLSPHLGLVEALTAWLMTGVCLAVAVLQLRVNGPPVLRIGLGLSSLALVSGMTLAAVYALAMLLGTAWLSIPVMIVTHGMVNSLGFALPGVLAWSFFDSSFRVRRASEKR